MIKHWSDILCVVYNLNSRCMALDEKRIDARKVMNCPCIKPKPDDWKPSRLNDIRIGQYVFGKMLPKMIFKLPMKVIYIKTNIFVMFELFAVKISIQSQKRGANFITSDYDCSLYTWPLRCGLIWRNSNEI